LLSGNRTPIQGWREINLADSEIIEAQAPSQEVTPAPNKYELTDPDVRLMLQVRDDNAVAFQQLVDKYQARLVSLFEMMVNRTQAEDLTQEVFLRVYRARARYTPQAKFSTWLFTISNNVASNALRKLSRRKEYNLTATPSGEILARPLDNMAKEGSHLMPARVLAQSEREEVVRMAIESLNPRQRMAILLSKFEGMSYIEIAKSMDLTTQAVKSLLSRARGNLKDILEPYIRTGQKPNESN
jgi:RNA polymerase sigma-70 factor (ECF subfamily)